MLPKRVIILTILKIIIQCSHANNLDHYLNTDGSTSTERNHYSMLCMDIKPQHSLDINQIMGMWYGSEIIMHTQDVPGVFQYDSCVIIHLSDVTEQMNTQDYDYYNSRNINNNNNNNNYRRTQYTTTPHYNHDDDYYLRRQQQQHQQSQYQRTKYLRLIWSESDNNLEYTFNYTAHSPGLWTNVGEQRGSLVSLNQYTQFNGSVQVVKAVNDHLVLTFCGNDIRSSIYTIVLSRNQLGLSQDELRSIRNLLSRRGLYTETIRKVCATNGASVHAGSWRILATLSGLFYLRKRFSC